jgi:hypothetical protein
MKSIFRFAAALLTAHVLYAQSPMSLTIYNKDMATVRDTRVIEFKKRISDVEVTNVAARIDPTSVQFSAPGVFLLEQNFDYDLISEDKLIRKFIGQNLEFVSESGQTVQGKVLSVLSSNNSYDLAPRLVVLQQADGSIRTIQPRSFIQIHYPTMPEGTISRPTLKWKVSSDQGGSLPAEISYLTHGLNWRVDYSLIVRDNSDQARLEAWVTIDNKSGASYPNAQLKLIAGDIAQAPGVVATDERVVFSAPGRGDVDQPFEIKGFLKSHLYTLSGPISLLDAQTKQLSLFEPVQTVAKRVYIFDPKRKADKVGVFIEAENKKQYGLGIPLPEGLVRVYQHDTDSSREYLGDDRIGHTAANEKIRVRVGEAFDIAVDYVKKSQVGWEYNYEVHLRNHKSDPVNVLVTDHFGGDWYIKASNYDMEKVNANTLECPVLCLPEEEVLIRYTVVIRP